MTLLIPWSLFCIQGASFYIFTNLPSSYRRIAKVSTFAVGRKKGRKWVCSWENESSFLRQRTFFAWKRKWVVNVQFKGRKKLKWMDVNVEVLKRNFGFCRGQAEEEAVIENFGTLFAGIKNWANIKSLQASWLDALKLAPASFLELAWTSLM